jgi:hypothetical protein
MIIQDKQQQGLDDEHVATQRDVIYSGTEVTRGFGFGLERKLALQIDKDLDVEGGGPGHSFNAGSTSQKDVDGEVVAT